MEDEESCFDEYEHYNFDQGKQMNSGKSGKQRSKKEASEHTNHFDPCGHSRKIVTKLQNSEKNKKEQVLKRHPITKVEGSTKSRQTSRDREPFASTQGSSASTQSSSASTQGPSASIQGPSAYIQGPCTPVHDGSNGPKIINIIGDNWI